MTDVRFVRIDNTSHVTEIVFGPEVFANYWYFVRTELGQVGDFWDGSSFITPPPPIPNREDMMGALNNHLSAKEQIRREAVLDGILSGNPPPQTMQDFRNMLALADPS